MNKSNIIIYNLNNSSNILDCIRESIKNKIEIFNRNLLDLIIITAYELCENAIKYGVNISNNRKMKCELIIDDNKIRIIVTNGVNNNNHITSLKKIIDLIDSSNNPFKLYIASMKQLLDNKSPKISHLGLLRIASECI